jgi:hypothetical protein
MDVISLLSLQASIILLFISVPAMTVAGQVVALWVYPISLQEINILPCVPDTQQRAHPSQQKGCRVFDHGKR